MSYEERNRHQRSRGSLSDSDGGWFLGDLTTGLAVSDAGLVLLLLIALLGGAVILIYFVAIVFVNLISFGEVHRASVYCRKVRRYAIDERKGCLLAEDLTETNIFFSAVLFVFTAEEAIRYFLNTGPATVEIWIFRIACLAIFITILAVFLVRLSRWLSFKSRTDYLETTKQIREFEEERTRLYQKTRTDK